MHQLICIQWAGWAGKKYQWRAKILCTKHNQMMDLCLAAKAFCVQHCALWLRLTSSGHNLAISTPFPLPDNAPAGSPIETGFCEDQQLALALQAWKFSCFQLVLGLPNLTSHQWSSREHAKSRTQRRSKWRPVKSVISSVFLRGRTWQTSFLPSDQALKIPHFWQSSFWKWKCGSPQKIDATYREKTWKTSMKSCCTMLHNTVIVSWSSARRGAKHARLENAVHGHYVDIAETLGCNPSICHLQAPSNINWPKKKWRILKVYSVSGTRCLPSLPKIMPYKYTDWHVDFAFKNQWVGRRADIEKRKSKRNSWAESLVVGTLATWRQAFRPQRGFNAN